MNSTPVSLLERLKRPEEQAGWDRFVHLYTPLLSHWAARLGLRGQDADDLVQDVFTLLVQKLPEFRHDPQKRFRGWLWTITLNKWRDRRRRQAPGASSLEEADLATLGTPDPAEEISEEEYRRYLVRRALEVMQAEFQPSTWQAFWEFVVCERPAAEVASQFGLSENAVYLARGRVLRRLRIELEGLLE
jgi:RNA polymerase sigma-70 factor (ECF subfamily)